jgi:hypothetical protein
MPLWKARARGATTPRALQFRGYEELDDTPHVMVDGSARSTSVATFSHWPSSPTPTWLARDLSAEIVLAYLRAVAGELPVPRGAGAGLSSLVASVEVAEAVTNDHFDEDGVMSVFAMVEPLAALAHAGLLVEAASCGDFGVVHDDEGAKVAFSLEPLAAAEGAEGTSDSYAAVLPVLPELLEHAERFARFWGDDFAALEEGRAALGDGRVQLDDSGTAGADLCVVRRNPVSGARLLGAEGGRPISEVAINSATPASRILCFDGDRCELTLRYEGWVRYISRPIPKRPDLVPLAERLSAMEPAGIEWEAELVGTIIGHMAPAGEARTEIPPAEVVAVVAEYLETAPAAWDPFRPGGSYVPH